MYAYNDLRGRDDQLTLSHRLCKLFACLVRRPFGVLSWVQLLTVSAFRLNSRDYIRGRSSADNPENVLNLSSVRFEQPSEAYGSQTGVSVTVHHSTASGFARSKSDHNVEPTFEVPKLV